VSVVVALALGGMIWSTTATRAELADEVEASFAHRLRMFDAHSEACEKTETYQFRCTVSLGPGYSPVVYRLKLGPNGCWRAATSTVTAPPRLSSCVR
jgi:hypothetical protein